MTVAEVGSDFNRGRRPAGAAYDIGAFEFGSVALPGAPANLRIVVPN